MNAMKRIGELILFAGLTLAGPVAMAEDMFPGREWLTHGAEGWWWYQDPPAEVVVEPPLPVVPAPPPTEPAAQMVATPPPAPPEPPPFSAAWFKAKLDGYREAAIDDPTPANLERYMYLQRVMMDKASAFTATFQEVVASTPYLDANNERPLDSAGANAATEISEAATEAVLRRLATEVGVAFFFRSDCALCAQEVGVLDAARRLYGFTVLAVSLDGKPLPQNLLTSWVPDAGQAAWMGVRDAPALVLMRPPSEFLGLSENVLSLAELAERILLRARAAGWISEAEFQATQPVKNRSLLALAAEITPEMLENPEQLSRFLHRRLEGGP